MPERVPEGGAASPHVRGRPGPGEALSEAVCVEVVRRELFAPFADDGPWRAGLEVEVLLSDPGSGRPVPPLGPSQEGGAAEGRESSAASAPLVGRWAAGRGWTRRDGAHGLPMWTGPDGAVVSYEPGGQLEYASPPGARIGELLERLENELGSLAHALEGGGLAVLARGVDPRTPLNEARLHLHGERYRRQARHYDRIGAWGRRMMRQSAALHLNVDPAGARWESWHLTNALAPILTAIFANSSRVAGHDSGWRSARSAQWRHLDEGRTGVFGRESDPPAAYAARALDAGAFLLGDEHDPVRPFRAWLREGRVDVQDWRAHLTTFFPEVRPRGYLEVRCVDALPLRWVGVPLLVLAGLLRSPTSRGCALELLPEPTVPGLVRAGRRGLGDPELARLAGEVMEVALAGLRALGEPRVPARWIERVEAFADRFTRRGRDPGHDPRDRFV